jgi:hypothetical protein
MAITQNQYTGDGTTVLFTITFPYLERDHVKASINGTPTTAFTFANSNTIQFNVAPANGATILLFRETDQDQLQNRFFPNSSIPSSSLNNNFTQSLYIAQETASVAEESRQEVDQAVLLANNAVNTANQTILDAQQAVATANQADANATAAVNTANNAVSTANSAVNTANSAVITANSASSAASSAVSTANTAASNASAALSAANAAVGTANQAQIDATAAVGTANSAAGDASAALSAANAAVITAGDADNTANNAESVANFAIATAIAAQNAVSAVVVGAPVADVAALLLLSPADGEVFEVQDSTGIESEPSVVNLPGGFVGDAGLAVNVTWVAANSEFEYISYRPLDPEGRYINAGVGAIVNADINASAAIADTKLATISTAGKVSNSATTATSSNTASAIVARDGSGNFSAGTITANLNGNVTGNLTGTASAIADNTVTSAKIVDGAIVNADINASAAIAGTKINPNFGSQNVQTTGGFTGSLTGNASTATTLATARNINGVLFDGSSDITITANTPQSLTPGTHLLGSAFNGSAARTFSVDATSANTASKIVARDASGNFSAGTITAALSGNATTATTATNATNCSRSVLAGNGLTGGGALSNDVTLTLGTPGSLTGSTTNSVTSTSHTHDITVNLGVTGGTTAGPTITSSAGTNATIPTASASASGVVTTGNQTWAGTKTFNNSIVSPGITRADSVTISSTDGNGAVSIEAQNISTGNVRSVSTFNNSTTTTGSEVRIISSGTLQRISSSIKYKKDVETLENQYVDAVIDNARPTWYRSKCESDNPDWGHYGFIAEELVQIDPRLVCLEPDENGSYLGADGNRYEPEGVQYQSIIPMLVNAIKRQKDTIQELLNRVEALEAQSAVD